MAVWGFVRLAGDRGPLIQGIGGIILGAGVYFVLTIILRSEEVGMLRRALHR